MGVGLLGIEVGVLSVEGVVEGVGVLEGIIGVGVTEMVGVGGSVVGVSVWAKTLNPRPADNCQTAMKNIIKKVVFFIFLKFSRSIAEIIEK